MRVGLVTPYSWTVPGGVNHHIEHLAAELEARGHEPWIIAPVGVLSPTRRARGQPAAAGRRALHPHGHRRPHPVQRLARLPQRQPSRRRCAWTAPCATGASTCCTCTSPARRRWAWRRVFLAASPVVGTFHAALESSFGYEHLQLARRGMGMERLDVRIAVSEAAREFPARLFPGDYRIIPNGVAVEKYAPAVGAAKVKGRVFFIGRAEKRKGLGVLLHGLRAAAAAAARTRRWSSPAPTRAAGAGGVAARLRAAARPRRASRPWAGWSTTRRSPSSAQAEVVCAPSLAAESFGIVLAEAMAAGVPVVASDLPGYRAVLRDGEAGRLVPPGEPGAARRRARTSCCRTTTSGGGSRPRASPPPRGSRGAASPTRSSPPTRTPWPSATGPASTACPAGRGSAGPCSTTRLTGGRAGRA